MTQLRVLIIEDSENDTLLLLRELKRSGYEPAHLRVETETEFRNALQQKWDIILSDFSLPRFGAIRALKVLEEKNLDVPFIAISGTVSETTILQAIKAGAGDYLMKGNLTRLGAAIERELRDASGRRERRKLEEQFRHAQRMEAVGRLAGGVAHDFNNLLTVITGYSDLLLSGGSLSEPQRAALEEIRKAAERGGGLTHQLLAFSRRQPLAPKIIHLNELVANMEKMLRRLIGEDVRLVTVPAPDLGDVKTDRGQFEQVIMNLVVNARDAMPNGGTLTIETANVDLMEPAAGSLHVKPGPYVKLAITDTGVGMDEATRSRLFEPFFTTKAAGKGTGLGLATAYGIIRQSGGSIAVESEPGEGASFLIYLPRVESGLELESPDSLPAESLQGSETVLVLEDEERVRRLICEVLSARGYRVLEATSGEEAIRVCGSVKDRVQLMVVDVIMPEMSGPEVVKQVAALQPGVRVLYISGYTDEAIVHHGVLDSSADFLHKPFEPLTLARKVREMLNQKGSATGDPN